MEESEVIQVFVSRLSGGDVAVLDDAEREAAARIVDAVRRSRYEQTRSFVRLTLAGCLGCDPLSIAFTRTAAGKPRVANPPRCEFSISHSSDWIAMATAPFAVGIDIEARAPTISPRALAARFFHPCDAGLVAAADDEAVAGEFLAQWVAKEAALKAAGTGIAGFLDRLKCEFANGVVAQVAGPSGRFAIFGFRLADGTPGAVAWEASIPARVIIRGAGSGPLSNAV